MNEFEIFGYNGFVAFYGVITGVFVVVIIYRIAEVFGVAFE